MATGAITGGRQNITGSTPVTFQGATFFRRPPSVSFQQESLPAFVSIVNNQFQFAILASCGNAVRATPIITPVPKRPVIKPTPTVVPAPSASAAPTQQQTQSQSQQVTVQTPVSSPASTPAPAAQPATTPAQSTLPNTGPTGLLGAFTFSSIAGMLGYRRFLIHKVKS